MRLLITGSNGLLGQKIVDLLNSSDIPFLATSLGQNRNSKCPAESYRPMDITDLEDIKKVYDDFQPTAVINTAAMTNVDACEDDEVNCRLINVKAVEYLAQQAKRVNAHFVHLSTDFVFDGENGPYIETDAKNPLSIYAKSKSDSENLLINGDDPNWAILRTIIVFGQGENMSRSNIVLWAKEALSKGTPLSIVDDQFRAPTWADDLAYACVEAAKRSAKGIYHICGPETFSVLELVQRIARFYGYDDSNIKPVSTQTLNQKAKKPPKTGFIIDKARKELDYQPLSFEESLGKLSE